MKSIAFIEKRDGYYYVTYKNTTKTQTVFYSPAYFKYIDDAVDYITNPKSFTKAVHGGSMTSGLPCDAVDLDDACVVCNKPLLPNEIAKGVDKCLRCGIGAK